MGEPARFLLFTAPKRDHWLVLAGIRITWIFVLSPDAQRVWTRKLAHHLFIPVGVCKARLYKVFGYFRECQNYLLRMHM